MLFGISVLDIAFGDGGMKEARRVVVNDLMQRNYHYFLTEPMGKNFHADFRPELTPKQMLALGVFGGKYMTDCTDEFPEDWFARAKLNHERPLPVLNFFGVDASQPLAEWKKRGWIYREDPRARRDAHEAARRRMWIRRAVLLLLRHSCPRSVYLP